MATLQIKPGPKSPSKTVKVSIRLYRSGEYRSRTLQVADAPRPRGRIEVNHKSVWIHRYVRAFNDIGVHKSGEWMPRTARYPLTPNRKRLIEALHADTIKPEPPALPPEFYILSAVTDAQRIAALERRLIERWEDERVARAFGLTVEELNGRVLR